MNEFMVTVKMTTHTCSSLVTMRKGSTRGPKTQVRLRHWPPKGLNTEWEMTITNDGDDDDDDDDTGTDNDNDKGKTTRDA